MAGLCRGRIAPRDRRCARTESRQPQAPAISRAAQAGRLVGRRSGREQTMTPLECEFESEVLAAVLQARWPSRVDAQLRAHVAACPICSDVAAIAGAIEETREAMNARAVIPNSGRVW